MRRLQRAAAAAVRGVIAAACLAGLASTALAQTSAALTQKSPDAAEIHSLAQTKGSVRVMVLYTVPPGPARANLGTAAEDIPAIVSENHAAQDTLLRSHVGDPLTLSAPNRALTRMDITPAFAINATEAEIMALANDPRVVTIEIDRVGAPHLIQSVPLIGMTNAYAAGATGSGWAVAVLDTGVETSHTFLTGQTIAEACFSTTQGSLGSGGSVSLCPGGASSSTAAGSGANCNIAWDGCEHGTHVAGISVGLNSQLQAGQPPNGVAKSGNLIAIKMYSEFNDATSCPGVSPCVLFFFSDFTRALDQVFAIRNNLPGGVKIAAVNLSGGGGHFSPPNCDTAGGSATMKTSIDNLRSAGIATMISAGNGGSRSQIAQPACISSAIAVAASSKTDVIASYTDISTQVAVFAPGGDFTSSTSQILSSVPAGFNAATFGFSCNYSGPVPSTGGSYCYLSGTSMAAPTVAGAWAAIRTVCPNSTVDQILNALISTGTPIADSRSGGTVTKNRIRVDLAVQQLACATPNPPPITSPAPGSTLTSNSVMFTGGHTASDLEHWLYAGTTLGGSGLFNQDLASGHAATVGGLPSTGTIFVRYWTRFGSGWQFTDQQYTMNVAGVPPSLSVNPTTVSAGGSVTATWSGIASPSATDWIGLYAPGTADTAYLAWIYVSCSKTAGSAMAAGSCAFPIPGTVAGGTYELRLLANNSFTRLATSNALTVTAGGPSLSVSPTTVAAGGSVTATWSGIASPSATDWIGLYAPGASDTAYLAWIYVSCSKTAGSAVAAGSCAFPIPSAVAGGTYELRLLANNGFTRLATSNGLTITAGLSVSPTTVAAGGSVTATWGGIVNPTTTDWIGLYASGAADTAYLAWIYVSCSKTAGSAMAAGSCAFPIPGTVAGGTYELRLFANNGFTKLATSNALNVSP